MKVKGYIRKVMAIALSSVIVLNMAGCGEKINASDLTEGVPRQEVTGKVTDESFINSQFKFYVDIFKNSVKESGEKTEEGNVLVSPLSIMLALSMTANGANGNTKEEMENVLANGMPIEDLNAYLYEYVSHLPSDNKSKLSIANSIWLRENFNVKKDFLQTGINYYDAYIYSSPFDNSTIDEINKWVKQHTDGMIDKIIEKHIDKDAVMYLINAIAFDSEWEIKYEESNIKSGTFKSYTGKENKVEMMTSEEMTYLEDENTIGFIKPYKNDSYSFVALLPDEDIDIYDYIESFSYEKYLSLMEEKKYCTVYGTMPKFSYEYGTSMGEILKNMGMKDNFSPYSADFSNIGDTSDGGIYIGDVIHKAFIEVDANGTKAGAATLVGMVKCESVEITENKVVRLDRPFVYMIIDNDTNLPIFMGAALDI